jgi:hypothetical protein
MKKIEKVLVTLPFVLVLFLSTGFAFKAYSAFVLWDEIEVTGISVSALFYSNLTWFLFGTAGLVLWFLRRDLFVPYVSGLLVLILLIHEIESIYLPGEKSDIVSKLFVYGSNLFFLFILNYSNIKQAIIRSKHGASS